MSGKSLLDYNLKPCPFCGGFAYLTSLPITRGSLYRAMCENIDCGAVTEAKVTPEAAAKVWNRRAPARNCDVGTIEEQGKRFDDFCHRFNLCELCPIDNTSDADIDLRAIAWAQLPYEAMKGDANGQHE